MGNKSKKFKEVIGDKGLQKVSDYLVKDKLPKETFVDFEDFGLLYHFSTKEERIAFVMGLELSRRVLWPKLITRD
jgi:hypothetical protein